MPSSINISSLLGSCRILVFNGIFFQSPSLCMKIALHLVLLIDGTHPDQFLVPEAALSRCLVT